MTIKKLTMCLALGMVLTLAAGCNPSSGNSNGQGGGIDPDSTGIPAEVLNYDGDIDVLLYIEGQNGVMPDAGNESLWGPDDIFSAFQARFVAAARTFKKIAPKVEVNISWCSIDEYMDTVANYQAQNGHLPHVMHAAADVYDMISRGFATDISQYSESKYYQAFDPSVLDIFNYGGFQGSIPYSLVPVGMFANTKALEDNYYEYNDKFFINEDGTVEWTYEKFVDICQSVFKPGQQAALGSMFPDIVSYATPTINMQLSNEGTIGLNTPQIQEVLDLEERLASYSVYNYPRAGGNDVKEGFTGVATWSGLENYINQEKYVFMLEAPWNFNLYAQVAQIANKDRDFDYLPLPAVDSDTGMTIGLMVGSYIIGNQCPIGATGVPQCGETGKLEQDAAAYFTMFMNADPRALEEKANIVWDDKVATDYIVGVLDLPLVKRNFNFDFEDPADGYAFDNHLKRWLNYHYMYLADSNVSDINFSTFEGLKPGFKQMMNIFYNNPDNRIIYTAIPRLIPGVDGTTQDIMAGWANRYTDYEVKLGQEGWASYMKSLLPQLETQINANMILTWGLLQEGLDTYYGQGLYTV